MRVTKLSTLRKTFACIKLEWKFKTIDSSFFKEEIKKKDVVTLT